MTGGAVAAKPLRECDPKGVDCLTVIWPSTFIHPQVNPLSKGSPRPDCQAQFQTKSCRMKDTGVSISNWNTILRVISLPYFVILTQMDLWSCF
jgi:hypothetical protein